MEGSGTAGTEGLISDIRWERPSRSRVVLTGIPDLEVVIQRNCRRTWEPWINGEAQGGGYANLTDARWDTEGDLRDRGFPVPEEVDFDDSHDDDDGGWCGNWDEFLAAQE
jgi:hypothetical protein